MTMYFIYILYSESADKFYIGYTSFPEARLIQHNTQENFNTYTRKYPPWILKALFEVSKIEGEAKVLEMFIKKQKSRKLIEKLCDPAYVPTGKLAQLVIPYGRDVCTGLIPE